jgi:hypothetical protein
MNKTVGKKRLKLILVALMIWQVSACSMVTINPVGHQKLVTKADYRETKVFYFWGFKGKHEIDVNHLCLHSEVVQMQTMHSLSNVVFSVLSFGLYYPVTVRVWCSVEDELVYAG